MKTTKIKRTFVTVTAPTGEMLEFIYDSHTSESSHDAVERVQIIDGIRQACGYISKKELKEALEKMKKLKFAISKRTKEVNHFTDSQIKATRG